MMVTTLNRFSILLSRLSHQAGLLSLHSVLSAYAQLQVGNDDLKEAIIDNVKLSVGGGELGKGEAGAGCGQEAGEEGGEAWDVPPGVGGGVKVENLGPRNPCSQQCWLGGYVETLVTRSPWGS